MAVLSLLIFHLHLLCDLVGSGGPGLDAAWPIHYLGPFSNTLTIQWSGQWQLNAWPNVALTLVLLAITFRRIILIRTSPTSLFGHRFDRAFVSTIQAWYGRATRNN
jgi:hypothetical protein